MSKIIGNFDDKGGLERLHLDPQNPCNTELDKATHVRELTWEEAFAHVASESWEWDDPDHDARMPEWYLGNKVTPLLCQHCGFA